MFKFAVILLSQALLVSTLDYSYESLISDGLLKLVGDHLDKRSPIIDTQKCIEDILVWRRNLTREWSLYMMDANGKLQTGLLTGNLHTLGQFDECLSVKAFENEKLRFRGKYCMAKLPILPTPNDTTIRLHSDDTIQPRLANTDDLERLTINWGVCIPDSCKAEQIQKLIRDALIAAGIEPPNTLTVPERYCRTDDPVEWTGGDIACVTVAGIWILIMACSTCYDLCSRKFKEASGRLHETLISFSVYTNSKKLTTLSKSTSTLRCIHGIRSLSILWVILGHRYISVLSFPMLNSLDIFKWVETYAATIIIAARLAVDTFFVLSGLLLSYLFFKQHHNKKTFNLPLFYLHRLIRLWPAMAALVFAQATIYKHLGSGPYWAFNNELMLEPCVKYWWTSLLYVQNYVNPMTQCIGQLWYICIDMHLYILSPILLYPLLRWFRFGIANMIFWLVVAQTTVAVITYLNDWSAAVFNLNQDATDFTINSYMPTHMRATPWVLGFAAGYLLYKTSHKRVKMNMIVVIIFWILSLAIICAMIFGLQPLHKSGHQINGWDATYNAFGRSAWSIALIWIIFACINGYGGPINWFLGLKIWELLGRFSYSMYLLHLNSQYILMGQIRTTGEFSHLTFVYTFFGDVVMTLLLSYIWILAFESPFLALEKAIFGGGNKKQVQSLAREIDPKDATQEKIA